MAGRTKKIPQDSVRVDVSTAGTSILKGAEASTGQPTSAAKKLLFNRGAPLASRAAAGVALFKGRKIREKKKKIKKSPGFTLEIQESAWPTGHGKANTKVLAEQKDSTEHHRGKPFVP